MGTYPRPPSLGLSGTMRRLSLLVLLFSYLTPLLADLPPAPDALTLLQFKGQLVADPSGRVIDTWNVNNLDAQGCPQNWYGVICSDQGAVVVLSLENLALQGELKSGTLGNLSGLFYLSLANNSLTGTIPDDLGNLSDLKVMILSDNHFEGPIPRSFLRLSQTLNNLSLAGNRLTGPIPDELGDMYLLTGLDLSRNQLTGKVPSSLVKLESLVALNLSSNVLDGSIPGGFSNLAQLERLDFHQNQLSGSIDPTLLTLNKTRFVDLSSNSFTGVLPWQMEEYVPVFTSVEHVNLSHNKLSGSLSTAGVFFAAALKVLDISHNELAGELPSFQYVTSLTSLRLGSNAFTGSVPVALITNPSQLLEEFDISGNQLSGPIGTITSQNLRRLNLSNNRFTGKLPEQLGECELVDLSGNGLFGDLLAMQNWAQSLKWLDLSSNQLVGNLPEMVVNNLFRLTHLNLSHNRLTGAVPSEYGSSRSLKSIDLSYNLLEGETPPDLFYASISDLLLSNNRLTGPIPLPDASTSSPGNNLTSSPSRYAQADTRPMSPLEVLDLSANNLVENIPDRIGSLVNLRILKLSTNRLTGTLPDTLSELKQLQTLDFSRNQLSGPLPDQLPSSLVALNLSNNHFTGTVPMNLTRFGESAFSGNEKLQWPLITPPPGRFPGQVNITRSGSKMSSGVKAGLIGGCTVGAALVVGICLFVYFRSVAKSNDTSPGSEFGGSKGFERCGRPGRDSTIEFDADVERSTLNSCTPVAAVKGAAARRTRGIPTENGSSPDVKMEEGDIIGGGLLVSRGHRLPSVTERDVLSPEHPLVTKVSPEHPVDMKCTAAPAHLVGDVYFLDKSVVFGAEDLSSAPAEILGKSSHGTSYKAVLENGRVLTVKWLKEGLAKCKKDFALEARKFGSVNHRNVVSLRGYYWGPQEHEKLLLSDYIEGGSLAGRLSEVNDNQGNDPASCNLAPDLNHITERESSGRRYPPLLWHQRLQIAVDVARGLKYLHEQHHWPHGNLKATNVLLREEPNFQACLSDFSLHRLMTSAGTINQLLNSGALGYRAPELAAAKKPKPSLKSDVFSFGVILMELITGKSAGEIISGSIISGSSGVVDLPDWVRLMVRDGHAIDCYDTALVGVDRDLEPPKGIEDMLTISLNCAASQSSRPSIRVVYEELAAINPD
ncbi:hypothetical protein MPTK1_5g21560 [Marchantia polymorpha subsp. ruderalis]|uniref:Protein kinase domain-containing protein n=2 Tax=Marchantia polymorpha TaxID=3197 RepID=A0A176WD77_MARPO|nr:hypothetical protein AXG93_3943s1050 [Marchantia polymorpha subsp. ruderalis]PTQ31858.1 hypothetical protein MARPO_0106s0043 [Marchantia polymorpha]BBN12613.1 hypothetical protein Mp_5g21560 [Marchantia polymorpha subsp. ruderalis]|eukprot:PTQ31858.1 hypothetical protein MARPO_0106s0043 [Marchantia polymorpha]